MSFDNLAIVFCSNMLRSRESQDDAHLLFKNSAREQAFVKALLEAW